MPITSAWYLLLPLLFQEAAGADQIQSCFQVTCRMSKIEIDRPRTTADDEQDMEHASFGGKAYGTYTGIRANE